MEYTFRYKVFHLGQECSSEVFNFESDSYRNALTAFSLRLVQLPVGHSVIINSYYRCNNDYRKFREREVFENFVNYSRGVPINAEN